MTERTVHTAIRLSAAEARKTGILKPKKRAKYRNVSVTVDGIRFASKREAAYYGQLKQREKAGEVGGVELQPRFPLLGNKGELICTYVADFAFWDQREDRFRVIDVKGIETEAFKLKRRMMRALKGIEVEVVK